MFDNYDYDTLCLLRKNTMLGPIAYLKVLKERSIAEEYQRVINKVEHCMLGVDYQKANELEYKLRVKAWVDGIMETWYKYADNQDLYVFAYDMLKQREEYENVRKLEK